MSLKSIFQPTAIASLIVTSLCSAAYAGIVRSDVDYQLFRDFAENKGAFKVGASSIPVYDNNNVFLGWVMKDIPMPDLRSANRGSAIATLFAPQYIMSVQHNINYENVQFGAEINKHLDLKHFTYMLVDRNNYKGTEFGHHDYHIPRLHKLVTEVVPAEHSTLSNQTIFYTGNRERFPAFARLGSGIQKTRDADGTERRTRADIYHTYLIGGTNTLAISTRPRDRNTVTFHSETKDLYDKNAYSPLTNLMQPGDSGSPLFVYDKEQGKWLLIGVLNGNSDLGNWYTMPRLNFINQQFQEDIAGTISNSVEGQQFTWTPKNHTSDIRAQGTTLDVPLKNSSLAVGQKDKPQLNHGKSVHFTGENGTLVLNGSIDQGAGALHFSANFTVKGNTDRTTWQGAGIIVDEGKTVDWQVLNPQGDRLSKLGKGTLVVNATGRNLGSISVGDGEVVLAQRGRNNRQPFSEIHIVSGRPTVTLADGLVRPENIYFGFRGGRLNLNGHSLVFDRIKSIDEGARIVNHNRTASSTLFLSGQANMPLTGFGGHFGEDDPTRYNGKLNVEYVPTALADSTLLFTGYADLNGNFTVGAGRAIISGKQPIHALDVNKQFSEIIKDDHWENRTFNATNVFVKDNATLHISRNVSEFNSNIRATNNASVQLGYLSNSLSCIRSDYTGLVSCNEQKVLTPEIESTLPITQARGNIVLEDKASLKIGKATLTGTIQNSYHSPLTLTDKAKWVLTDSSKLWNLNLEQGSQITLNEKFDGATNAQNTQIDKFNTLKINGNLTGSGKFNFLTDIANQQGDKVIVNGFAIGDFILAVKNSGNEPQNAEQLSLLKLNHGAQEEFEVNVSLENHEVDLGTYRYQLRNDKYDYRLHNPQKEQELKREKERLEAEEKDQKQALQQALEDERLAHQKAKQQASQAESANKQLTEETQRAVKELEQAKQKLQNAEIALANAKQEQKKAEDELANQPKLPPQRELISRYANTALSEWAAQRNQLTQVTESLNRHLLDSSEGKGNVWANVNGLNASYVSDNHRQYDQKAVLTQLGVNVALDEKQQMKVGLVLSKNDSNSTFADHHSAKSSLKMLSVLAKKSWDNGLFISFNGGYGRSDTTLHTDNQKQSLKRQLWHTDVNLGYQWKTDILTVQPMIGVGYQHISGVNYRLNNAEMVIDDLNFATYRAGLALHKTFAFGDWTVTPRFTSYYVDASQKKAILKSNGIALNQQAGRYLQNELGLSAQFKQWELNLHGGVLSGNQIGKQKFAGLKFGYKW